MSLIPIDGSELEAAPSERPTNSPLLTAEQEVALARRIRGEHVRVPGPGNPRPTPAEACNRLVEQSMGLVGMIARKYWRPPMSVEDLIQEGALGLRSAVERFDPDRGCRFSTFAFPWVQQAVCRAAAEGPAVIRLPADCRLRLRRLTRVDDELTQQLGRPPTDRESADRLGVSPDVVADMRGLARPVASLDKPWQGLDEGTTVLATLSDPGLQPDALEERGALVGLVRELLDGLPSRERQVVALRFGVGLDRSHSPEEVAKIVGVSRSAVRRITEQGLVRLRSSRLVRGLDVLAHAS
jgi:RNA polymerase sigma factor (sigma-70 family)